MRKLCILHFQEIEKYPPTINLLRFLHDQSSQLLQVQVLTSAGARTTRVDIPGIKIHRLVIWKEKSNRLSRMLLYIRFNVLAIIKLIRFFPAVILYYETLSSGPAWFYKKFIRRSCEIFVHYHEYMSKQEYEQGMVINKWLHEKEKKFLTRTTWLSHTNADRMSLFLQDLGDYKPPSTYIVPNYPPASWQKLQAERKEGRIGFVYVGALSLKTMFLREIADFVNARQDECYLDVYSASISNDVSEFFKSMQGSNITFKGEVPYDELPRIFSHYHIGLVLYKGHIPNYIYNVPNKLFEYHVCGLDVWFPITMKSSIELVTSSSFPKICAINFKELNSVDLRRAVDRSGLIHQVHDYSCEQVFKLLNEKLSNGHADEATSVGHVRIDSQGNS
jgi:hypothetical protein